MDLNITAIQINIQRREALAYDFTLWAEEMDEYLLKGNDDDVRTEGD